MSPAARSAIVTKLKDTMALQSLGVTQFMPQSAGTFLPPLPYVVYEALPGEAYRGFPATIEGKTESLRFHAYAETTTSKSASAAADAIAAAIETALQGFSSPPAVQVVLLETPTFDGPAGAEDIAHRIVDFTVLT